MLATNTSSIPIEKIAEPLADPGRLIGLHFFNPVAQLPLVEVVRGGLSRDEQVGKGCLFLLRIDKLPLIVISHGQDGWFGGHHDTAEALADAGFVVAAINHPGDNALSATRTRGQALSKRLRIGGMNEPTMSVGTPRRTSPA